MVFTMGRNGRRKKKKSGAQRFPAEAMLRRVAPGSLEDSIFVLLSAPNFQGSTHHAPQFPMPSMLLKPFSPK